jgi:hypothetical protein
MAIDALKAWLARAGLRGEPETALVTGFCERAVAAGLRRDAGRRVLSGRIMRGVAERIDAIIWFSACAASRASPTPRPSR